MAEPRNDSERRPSEMAGGGARGLAESSFARKSSAAIVWSVGGFLAGAVFWHFVGFWSFLGSIVLRGPEQAARREPPTLAQPVATNRYAADNKADRATATQARPSVPPLDGCAELAINREQGTTARRACPSDWRAEDLVETAFGKDDSDSHAGAAPLAVDGWSTKIDTGSIKR